MLAIGMCAVHLNFKSFDEERLITRVNFPKGSLITYSIYTVPKVHTVHCPENKLNIRIET